MQVNSKDANSQVYHYNYNTQSYTTKKSDPIN